MRRLIYVTGTRADFGLMQSVLVKLNQHPDFTVGLAVTGTHLSADFGHTVEMISTAGLNIVCEIESPLAPRTGETMALATGMQLMRLGNCIAEWKPDIVLVLGDRPEMLAGALAAALCGAIVVHVHGGERSGSIDESIRHAISKLAHYHFVATEESAKRLLQMGENAERIFVVGAPGLDEVSACATSPRAEIFELLGLSVALPLAVVLYHPVTQEQGRLGEQVNALLRAVLDNGLQAVFFKPNSDAGGDEIEATLMQFAGDERIRQVSHLGREHYLSLLREADIMVGNSSSGIIEAASFSLPVIDVGSRQNHRQRGENVQWVPATYPEIKTAVARCLDMPDKNYTNIYGDGRAGERMVKLLANIKLDPSIGAKLNAY